VARWRRAHPGWSKMLPPVVRVVLPPGAACAGKLSFESCGPGSCSRPPRGRRIGSKMCPTVVTGPAGVGRRCVGRAEALAKTAPGHADAREPRRGVDARGWRPAHRPDLLQAGCRHRQLRRRAGFARAARGSGQARHLGRAAWHGTTAGAHLDAVFTASWYGRKAPRRHWAGRWGSATGGKWLPLSSSARGLTPVCVGLTVARIPRGG
jgi:hypothetical protein